MRSSAAQRLRRLSADAEHHDFRSAGTSDVSGSMLNEKPQQAKKHMQQVIVKMSSK
ncbi:hypothetical protein MD588_06220 [Photobacterium sp. SDRW27]|uniref:hypothetical protein n=1 Tax=Photobacterium obscurum TaxID=2829490 RepID=UPI0022441B56|nr:hypothetical protein [Photobacterium obscurum]MCW8328400.1 hypothetical protein [Photobacterium obscurum]